jgi:hypothetical protein
MRVRDLDVVVYPSSIIRIFKFLCAPPSMGSVLLPMIQDLVESFLYTIIYYPNFICGLAVHERTSIRRLVLCLAPDHFSARISRRGSDRENSGAH